MWKGNSLKALLAPTAACLLAVASVSPGVAFDAELAATPGAGEPLLGGQTETAMAPDDPVASREIAVSGLVRESVESSLVRAGAPAGLSRTLHDALASASGTGPALDSGDMFHVRYEQAFAVDGREIGQGRIVSAEFVTAAQGKLAVYGFRPVRGSEQLWLASGESLSPPAMRIPLEAVNVSSGFGVRADPFEQPRHGLGAPSVVGSVGATINTATARGIALGLAPAPGRNARRPGATFLMHQGVDLVAASGTPVHAAADGAIVGAAPNAGYGNWIRIQHAHNVATVYGHLSAFAAGVSPGAEVQRGQVIGYVGSTGRSTGAHLHFEVIEGGRAVDPMAFPATKRTRLAGPDLERFRKLVRQAEAERRGEAAFLLIKTGGLH